MLSAEMRNPLGLHLPDRDHLTDEEMALVLELRPSVLLSVAYSMDRGGAEDAALLAVELGHTDLLVRCYEPNIPQIGPWEWAEECARRLARYDGAGLRLHCIPGNEMNLAAEGGHEDIWRHARWLIMWAQLYETLRDDARHVPAPWAGWVGEDEARALAWFQGMQEAQVMDWFTDWDVHSYGDGFGLWRRAQEIMRRPGWITECNQMPLAFVREALQEHGGPLGAAYFSLNWVNYEPGKVRRDDDVMSLMHFPDLLEEFRAQALPEAPEVDPLTPEEPPVEPQPPVVRVWTLEELVSLAKSEADRVGIPRRALLGLLNAESRGERGPIDQFCERWGLHTAQAVSLVAAEAWSTLQDLIDHRIEVESPKDLSFGPAQQTVAYAPVGDGSSQVANVLEVRRWLFDPSNAIPLAADRVAAGHRDEADADFRALCRYNWPAGDGRAYTLQHAVNYRRGLTWADELLGQRVNAVATDYDPGVSMWPQATPWTCFPASAAWALRSIGIPITEMELARMLGHGIVNESVGLVNGDGIAAASALQTWAAHCEAVGPVSWEDLSEWVGKCPVLIGSRSWGAEGHWSGVRGFVVDGDGESWLSLANPAHGHGGFGQVMSWAQFEELGRVYAVLVGVNLVGIVEQLEGQLGELQGKVDGMAGGLAHLVDKGMEPLTRARLSASERRAVHREGVRIREEFVGPYEGRRV